MPRKRKQSFSFPSADQPSDKELDASIDGPSETPQPAATDWGKNAADKKKNITAVKEIPQIFTPEQVAWVFDVYVVALCFVFSIVLKTDFKVLHNELKLDEDVKIAWAKPLARIASKYAPSEWATMTAEIELIACIGMYTVAAFPRAKQAAADEKLRKEKEAQEKRQQQARNPGARVMA